VDVAASRLDADLALVARARDGDVTAFETLLRARVDGLYRSAWAILRDEEDARDATQEASLAAWRELPRLRELDRFDAWLGRILLNACRMALRRRRRRPVVTEIEVADIQDPEGMDGAAPGMSERAGTIDAIRRAFARLSPDHRLVLALHHGEGRALSEIAGLLGVAEGTVKWRLHEARRALEQHLDVELR
jgi:RNA polymerase sigma-70 factor (ECF subfamily)